MKDSTKEITHFMNKFLKIKTKQKVKKWMTI